LIKDLIFSPPLLADIIPKAWMPLEGAEIGALDATQYGHPSCA